MKRLDQRLVDEGLAPSRAKAQQMIDAGEVEIEDDTGQWHLAKRPSQKAAGRLRLAALSQTLKFVSRGGLKLESALNHLRLNPEGWRCLDIGQSTGGFTDALLKAGAKEVAGVDVGHGQLAEALKADHRVLYWEGVHVRDLPTHPELKHWLSAGPVDLCVIDLSFISLTLALPPLREILPQGSRLLALIKPQFEAGAQALNRRGVVTDPRILDEAGQRVLQALAKYDFSIKDYFLCAVKGSDGNQEFFAFAVRG